MGRWEGDTLVVESNGFNEKTWLSRYGQSHTEALRVTERYRRRDVGHLRVEVIFTDPRAYTKPWGFTAELALAADTEMLESICERTSDEWHGGPVAADTAVTVAPEVLARYVGVYHGMYGENKRAIEVSLSGDQLIAKVTGARRHRRRRDATADTADPRRCSTARASSINSSSATTEWRRPSTRFTSRALALPETALTGVRVLGPWFEHTWRWSMKRLFGAIAGIALLSAAPVVAHHSFFSGI